MQADTRLILGFGNLKIEVFIMALGKKTGGRVKGTPNKSTDEIKALAQQHGPKITRQHK
jgi:hypothetical protein